MRPAIGAIADAVDHLRHIFFTKTRVSAGVARLGAGVAGSDALDHGGVIR